MSNERAEALATARTLVGAFDSAPDPLKQAQSAVATLLQANGWGARS